MEGFQPRISSLHSHRPIRTITPTLLLKAQEGNQEEQDLFDYFDPLLSPHAYPNGIDAGPSTSEESSSPSSSSSPTVGFVPSSAQSASSVVPAAQSTSSSSVKEEGNHQQQDQDLFDYFDPLLSPHAYPNGINAGASTTASTTSEATPISSFPPSSPLQVVPQSESTDNGSNKKVGVLLMDHGSRNSASNARLEKMAELYQLTANYDDQTTTTNTITQEIVVEAAHMEIASPSIAEGLKKLLDQGVDEIICHPYFLSPGRHVTEDIPQLLEEAKNELQIDIPMVTTQPIGANTQLMIGAIHALVQENSSILQNQNQQ